jgi:type IV pilus assembly protein PilM
MELIQAKAEYIWKKRDVIGVDIGSGSLKLVQLAKKGKLTKLIGYGKVDIPENYIIEGIVVEPEKLAEVVNKFLAEDIWGKITAKRVCTSLPESKIFTRTISLPHMQNKALAEAINWEASQTIPMALTDLYLDWQVIGPSADDPKNDEVIYAAAPRAIVDSYMHFFNIMGWEVESIETSLTAIVRSVVPKRKTKEAALIIDMGSKTTNLAVFDQLIRLTGSTLIGGDHITYRIAEVLKIGEIEAEKLKKQKSSDKTSIRQAVDVEVTEITKEATKMINYYQEKSKKVNTFSRVILCGGGASLAMLTEIFAEKLGIPAEVGNPWANISVYPLKSVPKDEAPIYTNAVGLALLGVIDD